jgi:hypothetical protein
MDSMVHRMTPYSALDAVTTQTVLSWFLTLQMDDARHRDRN